MDIIIDIIVDTGADISIFKRGHINVDQFMHPSKKCTIVGVTGQPTQSRTITKINSRI